MEICSFLKILDKTEKNQSLVNSVVNSCTKEKLQKIEKQMGAPLAKDQTSSPQKVYTHIRSGKVGRWKGVFTKKDLSKANTRFKEFGYNLSDFTTE